MFRLHLWNVGQLLLYFALGQFYISYAKATWPSTSNSSIQLLGLFEDLVNVSGVSQSVLHTRAMFKTAIMLSQQYNITIDGQLIGWQTAQTGGTFTGSMTSTCRVLSNSNLVGIVGPSFSREGPVVAATAEIVGIPTISYAATDPGLSDKVAYPAFYRTIPSDSSAALAITKLFVQYNWTSAIIIYQNDQFGIGGTNVITDSFNKNNLQVTDTLLYDTSALKFRGDLKTTLISSTSRIVILWAETYHTSIILQNALDNNVLGPQFLWILASSVPLTSFNQTYYPQLIGIITIEAAVATDVQASANTTLLNAAYAIWQQYEPQTFLGASQVHTYGFFAFDAAWTLIQSLQKLCSNNTNHSSSCLSFIESTFCYDRRLLGASSFFDIVNNIEFLGVSGPIKFSNNTTNRIIGNYFIAKNIQSSSNTIKYVSVLQWSDTNTWQVGGRTNVIVWPGNTSTRPTGIPGLEGITLRIGVILSLPFVMQTTVVDASGNSTIQLVGYAIDLINYLQAKMGFIPEIMIVSSDLTYDQAVQTVADNIYDIIVSDVTITAERRKYVDFSNSIYYNSLRLIVRAGSDVSVDLLSYMQPFSVRLWLVILAALVYAGLIICILERQKNGALKYRSILSSVTMSIWYAFGTMAGFGVDFDVQTAAGRLLTAGLYILSIILVASYTANLASALTISKSQNIISGIDDIKSGKISYSRIGILVGTSIEDYYLRDISGGSRNYYPVKSSDDIYPLLLNNTIDVGISDAAGLEYATNNIYCNLTLVGSDFDPSAYGIVMRKQWLYSQILDVNILLLREAGIFDGLKRKWLGGNTCPDSSGISTTTTSGFTIESLGGLFLTFFVISLFSLILFVWLHRLIIKDYIKKFAQRKKWLPQRNDVPQTVPYHINIDLGQVYQSDAVTPILCRL